jgi:hypothetical protein
MKEEKIMKTLSKSLFLVFFVSFTFFVLLAVNNVMGEKFTPPVPDQTKTLPANDGEPDGCDSSRFKCVMDGAAVQDKQTGLIWLRDTRFDNKKVPWQEAADFCQSFELGDKKDWRLPTRDELITLLDTSKSNPAFPDGHPFKLMESAYRGGGGYWASTEYEGDNKYAWSVGTGVGGVDKFLKALDSGIWPVREGE